MDRQPARLSPNRLEGRQQAARRGWPGSQWVCLERLWTRESQWDELALNDNTGNGRFDAGKVGRYADAYGIPQALPPNKMASAGPDWRTNPATQIRWGLGYIKDRYRTPCRAWAAWSARSPHWY